MTVLDLQLSKVQLLGLSFIEENDVARTKSLSRHLRMTREARGLSVADLADRVGVSAMSVYNWESGRSRPRVRNLSALSKALRLRVSELELMTGT